MSSPAKIASLPDDQREVIEVASTVGLEFTAESVWSRLGPNSTVDIAEVEDRCDLLASGVGLLADAAAVEWPDGTIGVSPARFPGTKHSDGTAHRLLQGQVARGTDRRHALRAGGRAQ